MVRGEGPGGKPQPRNISDTLVWFTEKTRWVVEGGKARATTKKNKRCGWEEM